MARRKYGNRPTAGSASKKEAKRAAELRLLEKAGAISDLKLQPVWELIPSQYAMVQGKRKCIERAVTYRADASYIEDGQQVVEDTKSIATRTQQYIIRRKILLHKFGIRVRET